MLASHNAPEVAPEIPPESSEQDEDDKAVIVTHDIGILTDVCNSAYPDEVEILSLIEEQIPRYRLRSDTITDFTGYSHQDFIIQTPVVPFDENLDLNNEQIKETLKYFVLCADRVTQMTKTYNDIEAVTRLLEEKERDLELAARIGTTLLEKNRDLEHRSETLELHLSSANEKVSQLRYDLSMKDELLRVYCEDLEEDESEAPQVIPEDQGLSLSIIKLEGLHKKVKGLENENLSLRLETAQLKSDTGVMEEKEKKLVEDCLQQLAEVNVQVETFAEELSKKSDDNLHQKEEITILLSQVVDLQKRVRSLTIENMELSKHLQASQESQRKLTKELGMMQDRYDELFELLEEANDELKVLRRKQRPSGNQPYISNSLFNVPSDSLASEIEFSMKSEGDHPSGLSSAERRAHNWKIFETAKAAKKAAKKRQQQQTKSASCLFPTVTTDNVDFKLGSGRNSSCLSDGESAYTSDGYGGDIDSVHSAESDLGRPGIPGSNDLETALKHLAMRKANELNEKDYYEEQLLKKQKELQTSESSTPSQLLSPGNMSTGSTFSIFSYPGSQNNPYFRIPEKLQIVKPLEGSATLKQWQQLATPHIGGIFENRPGVQIKGERKLNLEDDFYTLSDYEEDDEFSDCPSRRLDQTSSPIYTYTNSTVKHPHDYQTTLRVGTSVVMTPMQASTPSKSINNQTSSNYSMSLGLAAILGNRESPKFEPGIGMRSSISKLSLPLSITNSKSDITSTSTSPEKVTPTNTTSSLSAGGNLLNKLKNTGATFFEYLGGVAPTDYVSSSSSSVSSETLTDANIKVITSTATSEIDKGVSSKLLQKSGTSVLGALTSFRRSGIL